MRNMLSILRIPYIVSRYLNCANTFHFTVSHFSLSRRHNSLFLPKFSVAPRWVCGSWCSTRWHTATATRATLEIFRLQLIITFGQSRCIGAFFILVSCRLLKLCPWCLWCTTRVWNSIFVVFTFWLTHRVGYRIILFSIYTVNMSSNIWIYS